MGGLQKLKGGATGHASISMRALDLDKVDERWKNKKKIPGEQHPFPTLYREIYGIGAVSAPPHRDTTEKTGCKPPDWRLCARVAAKGSGPSSRPALACSE